MIKCILRTLQEVNSGESETFCHKKASRNYITVTEENTAMEIKENLKERNDITAVEIIAHEWFDKTYGNSYFVAEVSLFERDILKRYFVIPFTYGYGDHANTVASQYLGFSREYELRQYAQEKGILLSKHKNENCLKRELTRIEKYATEV